MSQRVYLAGPFFSDAQIERLDKVNALLTANETIGYIYEPRAHQNDEIVSKYPSMHEAMQSKEWQVATYRADVQAMHQADVIVAVYDFDVEGGNVRPDEGTIWEMGYAIAIGKPVVIVEFSQNDEPMNLMLAGSYTAYFWGTEDIKKLVNYNFIDLPYHGTEKEVF